MRWTGNHLADGTAVVAGNVNGAGSDVVTYQTSGASAAMVTEGDGVHVYGPSSTIRRLDAFLTTKQMVTQTFYTPRQHPTSSDHTILSERTTSGDRCSELRHASSGLVSVVNAAAAFLHASPVPLVLGHRYRIDRIVAQAAAPTTTNGRIITRVVSLTDPAWNAIGSWYVDTGYTVNAGTIDLGRTYFGLCGGGAIASGTPALFEQLGWDSIATDLAGVTTRSAVEALFMPDPYAAAPVTSGWQLGSIAM